jgi:signal peptidase II
MFFVPIILIAIDQITKYLAIRDLKGSESIPLISDFLQLTYVENRGAAFGLFQDQKLFFVIVTIVVLSLVVTLFITKGHSMTRLSRLSLHMILGGALGNFIDRIRLGYVVDFIDVKFGSVYDFPVFNIADMSLVIGSAILMILIVTDKYER